MADDDEAISLKMVADVLKKLDQRLENLERLVIGDFSVPGNPKPGLVVAMQQFSAFRVWVLGLLGAIATAVIVNAIVNIIHVGGAK